MASKLKTVFVCSKCDSQFPRWQGRCSECSSWGTLNEQTAPKGKEKPESSVPAGEVIDFGQISTETSQRLKTGLSEFDRVLGGGVVPGSLTLIGGEPGIGKSTLILQVAALFLKKGIDSILYVSGEESPEQIKMRLDRLKFSPRGFKFLGETDLEVIKATIQKIKPSLLIIDSIQTMEVSEIESEPGGISQVRATTVKLVEIAKETNLPIFMVGHITKGGEVAGPKSLEHLVDTVLNLEGDRYQSFRILRTSKNRFGSVEEVGIFEMEKSGLEEVKNPSQLLLKDRLINNAGSIVTCIIEGKRPFLVEIQALVSKTNYGYPQRRAAGFNFSRLQLLISVLIKRCVLGLGNQDIQVNVVGGLKVLEPAGDLAVALAIASAFKGKALDSKVATLGEVGLGGELRGVSQTERRLKEISKLGFEKVIMPEARLKQKPEIEIVNFKTLDKVIKIFLK